MKTNGSTDETPALRGMLAFHSYTAYETGDSRLFLFDFGTGVLSCPSDSWNTVYHAMNAHFSPDGRLLAFMGICKDTDRWDVFIHEVGSEGEPANITHSLGGRNEDPKWHPVQSRIIFKHDRRQLVETDADSSRFDVILDSASETSMPYYTVDGQSILFSRNSAIGIVDVRSRTERILHEMDGAYYPIAETDSSFLFACHKSRWNKHDQVYRGFVAGGKAVPLAFNLDDSDASDPYPAGNGWIFFSSTRGGGGGGYDLFIGHESGTVFPLSVISPQIATERNDLGACYWDGHAGSPHA